MDEAGTLLEERVTRLFASRMHLEVPSIHTDLFETGALDSLGFADLIVRLEEEFGIRTTLEDLEIENFRTIASIAAFVRRQDGSKGTGEAQLAPAAASRGRAEGG